MYKHALDPAEGNGEGNVLWGFDFKILPTGVHGADRDGLKHTQEVGGANGHMLTLSTYKISLHAKSLAKCFNLKAVIVWGLLSRE